MYHYIVYIIFVYLVGTHVEYLLHRFIMHKKHTVFGRHHITHHIHTNDTNMQLENTESPDHRELHPTDGLLVTPTEFIPILAGLFLTSYLFNRYYPVKLPTEFLVIVPILMTTYAVLTWNTIHTDIHNRNGQDMTFFAIPVSHLKGTTLYDWIVDNHIKHHIYKGEQKGNYNITLPGADFLWGTYN